MALTNLQVLELQINDVKKELATEIIKRSDANWERLTRFIDDATITSQVNTEGTGGFSQVEAPWLGLQNRGAQIPPRFARNAKYMRFTVGGRGTLVRNSLDSVQPQEGTQVVYAKSAKGFILFPGNWDKENIKDILENL